MLDGVNKWFGELHVLKDIELTVSRGEVVVVIGPSGSGKSTLCRAINRLETIDLAASGFDRHAGACLGVAAVAVGAREGLSRVEGLEGEAFGERVVPVEV